jgi:hypothetical protein
MGIAPVGKAAISFALIVGECSVNCVEPPQPANRVPADTASPAVVSNDGHRRRDDDRTDQPAPGCHAEEHFRLMETNNICTIP